jgi:hypothetical protein
VIFPENSQMTGVAASQRSVPSYFIPNQAVVF